MMNLPEQLEELKNLPQWVCHLDKRPKNPKSPNLWKISQDPNTANAQQNNSATWGTYDQAIEACKKYNLSGVGFQFGVAQENTVRVSGIDLDRVIRDDGTLEPFAAEIVKLMDSYTERSVSGKGLHILCVTSMENVGCKKNMGQDRHLEMYNHRHYFTVTGDIFGSPRPIQERTEQFKQIHERYFRTSKKETMPQLVAERVKSNNVEHVSGLKPDGLWDRIFKTKHGAEILDLYNGKTEKYGYDASRADLALCSALAYFTGGDASRIDQLFRQSGLMRPKWDEKHNSQGDTYGDMTIRKAIDSLPQKRTLSAQDNGELNVSQQVTEETDEDTKQEMSFQSLGNYLQTTLKSDIERFRSFKDRRTGFSNLDKEMNGHLYPGLYIVAATSSLGKTTFCHQLGDNLARAGDHVLFFSLEQSRFELATKGISRLTAEMDMSQAVSAIDIREGHITDAVKKAIETYASFSQYEVLIECGFETKIETVKGTVEAYISQTGSKPVVIVDYLQIIRPIDMRQMTKDAVDTHIRALKKIQSDNDLVVITISSLNRQNYLAPINFEALKESGNLEYSCDVLWGLQLEAIHDQLFERNECTLKSVNSSTRPKKNCQGR